MGSERMKRVKTREPQPMTCLVNVDPGFLLAVEMQFTAEKEKPKVLPVLR